MEEYVQELNPLSNEVNSGGVTVRTENNPEEKGPNSDEEE